MSENIVSVKAFVVRPNRHNLVVVKVTLENGAYGYGCATFQQRPLVVKEMVDKYLEPILIGLDSENIEDIWNLMHVNAYWRNGPIINNAIAGVDMALWDIKSKKAGLPLYQLFGGKSKNAIAAYTYAEGKTVDDVIRKIKEVKDQGYKHIRCQLGLYGGTIDNENITGRLAGEYYNPKQYMERTIELFKTIREEIGYDIELIHDVHERLSPNQAVQFAKKLEKYDLFFLEDPLPPEQLQYLKKIKSMSTTPIAIGELFNNVNEWRDIVVNGEVDFIRCHVSQIGGITPALKLMALCDLYGVGVAWHGPSDMTPIGTAVNTHLNIFGKAAKIQEYAILDENTKKLFPGFVEVENGMIYPTKQHGIGVGIDETLIDKYPVIYRAHEWTVSRLPDGTLHTP